MRPSGRALLITTFVLLPPACDSPEPLGPTPIDEGIVIFLHAGFRGTSQQIGADVSDLSRVEGPCGTSDDDPSPTWNDCISSVRVLPGWGARLYGDRNYRGAMLELTEDAGDLGALSGSCSGSYNDCISSVRVFRR